MFVPRTAPSEETELIRPYWQNSVLDNTKGCALTKSSQMYLPSMESGVAGPSTIVADMPSDKKTEI